MRIAIIPGDGIGIEVIDAVLPLMDALDDAFKLGIQRVMFDWGADKWLSEGVGLPGDALTMLPREFDYILFGAVGDPRIPDMAHGREILLGLRRGLSLYVNYRPLLLPAHRVELYRENTQGLYAGVGGSIDSHGITAVAIDECVYTRDVVTRFISYCLAQLSRRGIRTVTLVHKANAVPNTGQLWRAVFWDLISQFPALAGAEEYVDSFCYKFVRDPRQYEAVLAPNLFGDIISDLGAALMGGLGMAPSANICPESGFGLFEPVHGSAPDIVGTGAANPAATALSLSLLLDHAGKTAAAATLRECVLEAGTSVAATPDVGGTGTTTTFVDTALRLLNERIPDPGRTRTS